ncbi:MAG: nucleotidyltransferase family protein [Bacteroidales bacterium]|jgi:D-glycero-alpha-D-manno-heptose 1-phosphate guanylyltransferase|nr:nucleotidyltransferase family protein [Bacteroidales bacterium]
MKTHSPVEAIVLAGGLGTRLRSVVADLPKPMAPVNGRPFLEWLLRYLKSQGVGRFLLSVGYKHEIIVETFGDVFESVPVTYIVETEPLGTGGAVALALRSCVGDNVLTVNGDTFFPVDIAQLQDIHLRTNAEITLALKYVADAGRYGAISMGTDNIVTAFAEKSRQSNVLINGGIALINRQRFQERQFPDRFSLEQDYLAKIAAQRLIAGAVFDSYFIDMGTPESYADVCLTFH